MEAWILPCLSRIVFPQTPSIQSQLSQTELLYLLEDEGEGGEWRRRGERRKRIDDKRGGWKRGRLGEGKGGRERKEKEGRRRRRGGKEGRRGEERGVGKREEERKREEHGEKGSGAERP